MDTIRRLVQDFEHGFNRGVETGDFRRMLKLFAPHATLSRSGNSGGPFVGVDAIAKEYRLHPPPDQIEMLDVHDRGVHVQAGFSWLATSWVRAGEMLFVVDDGLIESVEILA